MKRNMLVLFTVAAAVDTFPASWVAAWAAWEHERERQHREEVLVELGFERDIPSVSGRAIFGQVGAWEELELAGQ